LINKGLDGIQFLDKGDILEERRIENRLKKEIELIGGKALKFISPGMSGVPDRIVLLPEGKVIFIELKAPGEKMRKLQVLRRKQFEKLGFKVLCIDSIEKVDNLIKEINSNGV
jgi:hypothetical protein